MAAHAFLLCSVALLSALCRPGLSFTDEDSQPGLTFDEVPEILDIRRWGLVSPAECSVGRAAGTWEVGPQKETGEEDGEGRGKGERHIEEARDGVCPSSLPEPRHGHHNRAVTWEGGT
ncbi:unnamed protein product [Arctogadus glacialis]